MKHEKAGVKLEKAGVSSNIYQNLQENTCTGVSILMELQSKRSMSLASFFRNLLQRKLPNDSF